MAANDCSAGEPTKSTTRAKALAGPRRTTRHLAEAFGPPTGTPDQFQGRADQVWGQAAGQQKLTWRLGVLAFHCPKKCGGMSGFGRKFRVIRLAPGDDGTVPVQRQDAKAPRCLNSLRSTIFLPSRSSMPRVCGSHPPRSGASAVGYDCFAGAPTRGVPAIVTAAAPGCRFNGVESEVINLITSQLTARPNQHDPRTPGPTPRIRSCRSQYRALSRLWPLSEGTGVLAVRRQHITPQEPREMTSRIESPIRVSSDPPSGTLVEISVNHRDAPLAPC
jgi:hypothetical protein